MIWCFLFFIFVWRGKILFEEKWKSGWVIEYAVKEKSEEEDW